MIFSAMLFIVKRVRLVEVAHEAGVHTATASRALNPATRNEVSRRTIRRVEQAAQRLGYVPNVMARGLRTARSHVVTLVIPDITNPLFPPLVRGAERVLSGRGFTLVLTDTNNDPLAERAQIASMRGRGTDGFIVATAYWEDLLLDEMAASDVPVVLVNRDIASHSLPYIGGDDRRGVQLCVDHLVGLGHRRLVHLSGPPDTSTGRERASAFRQSMRAHKLPAPAGTVVECRAFTEQAGAEATRKLLASGRQFTAVVAGNDLVALGAQAVLAEHGMRCPVDVSITGINDLAFMDKLTPALTTVRMPMHDMGALAARTLLDRIDRPGEQHLTHTLLPVELVVRGTTCPAAAEGP
ncbi:MAG: LacI family transcriptional regulator [Pseudonocardiales bacterium]|jgi:LacI family transcriptional regulator|nr:LacI family transcriptional regulator [Pseudonocardiales bacterium]